MKSAATMYRCMPSTPSSAWYCTQSACPPMTKKPSAHNQDALYAVRNKIHHSKGGACDNPLIQPRTGHAAVCVAQRITSLSGVGSRGSRSKG